jgi:hypothetical protein
MRPSMDGSSPIHSANGRPFEGVFLGPEDGS